MNVQSSEQFAVLEKKVKSLYWIVCAITVLIVLMFALNSTKSSNRVHIIHANGMIIEEDVCNDPILIGSPIQLYKHRVKAVKDSSLLLGQDKPISALKNKNGFIHQLAILETN
jgi:hypothetical protein